VSESALAARLERWRLNGRGRVAGGPLVGLSALTGLPPFYLLSIAAPALGVRFRTFLVMGLAGRLLRFGALVLLPGFLSRVVRLGGL
jgi:membrane protein YqaA with SNARE-associated domain